MKEEQLTLEQIKRYAKRKTRWILISLIISGIGLIIGCLFSIFEGIQIIETNIALPAFLLYIASSVVAFVAISHYEKVRYNLIYKVDTKTFGFFFDYFLEMRSKKKTFEYYEIKDIFMYGLWAMKDTRICLKEISETDSINFNIDEIKDKVSCKEFLASSIFRCLTFHKNGILYRNQYIFLDQNKFSEIIKLYSVIYKNKNFHTLEYLKECHKIEKRYYEDKQYAIENYKGLAKNIGRIEKFVNFSNNAKSVKYMKKILAIFAIIGVFVQHINNTANIIVTVFYEGITIILLLVDVTQRDEEKNLH